MALGTLEKEKRERYVLTLMEMFRGLNPRELDQCMRIARDRLAFEAVQVKDAASEKEAVAELVSA